MNVKQEPDNGHNHDNDPLQVDEVDEITDNVHNQNDDAHDNVHSQNNVDFITDEIDVEELTGDAQVSVAVLYYILYYCTH